MERKGPAAGAEGAAAAAAAALARRAATRRSRRSGAFAASADGCKDGASAFRLPILSAG